MESLETRTVLSTVPLGGAELGAHPAEVLSTEPISITAVVLKVNDRDVVLRSSDESVQVQAGDRLAVVGISYRVSDIPGLEGVVAMEGYLRKATGDGAAFDYSDGRFGHPDGANSDPLAKGLALHPGLEGEWVLTEADERLSLALVRYHGDDAVTEARFFVDLHVGQPDFLVDESFVKQFKKHYKPGKPMTITGTWRNAGAGSYLNHSEVDVFFADDMRHPIWVGTLSGRVGPGESVTGEYLNENDHDAYAERWVPERPGVYVVRAWADPQQIYQESDETNNFVEARIFVKGKLKGAHKDKHHDDKDDADEKEERKKDKEKDKDKRDKKETSQRSNRAAQLARSREKSRSSRRDARTRDTADHNGDRTWKHRRENLDRNDTGDLVEEYWNRDQR